MKHLVLLFSVTLALAAIPASAEPQEQQVIHIRTLAAQMKYDVTEMFASPGQPVRIVFENGDDLPHNIVFCNPDTDTVALSMKQMEKPEEALKRNWLPEDPAIWAHSRMLNPHEADEFGFTAPEKPGSYPFVCTFPGHSLTMRGNLRVSPQGEGLNDLKFKMYLGDWDMLPDFGQLTPHRKGGIEDNLIQVKLDDYKNQFGVVFTGKLDAPKEGNYRFYLACDDGGRILVDGKSIIENDGIHPASDIKEGTARLAKGEHTFRLEYFQDGGDIDIFAAWKGPGFDITPLSLWRHPKWRTGTKAKTVITSGMPLVVEGEPVIYRNFIAGAGRRGIGVGYPGGVNIAWSAEGMNLAMVWRGAFIDAARHWNSRGGGPQPPLGYDVLQPAGEGAAPLAVLESEDAPWPTQEEGDKPAGYSWKGYKLDAKRIPTFLYEWQGAQVEDRFEAQGNGTTPEGRLIRTVKLAGDVPARAFLRIATGSKIEPKGDGFLVEGMPLKLENTPFANRFLVRAEGARQVNNNLIVPAQAGAIKITYQWP